MDLFNRFTDRARKVMALANQEAKRFNHEYIGTEHILLGLVKEGSGVGAAVLKNLDMDLKKARSELERLVKSGEEVVAMGKLPQTPRAKRVIEYAIEESRALNHNYVGTEHILLGLIREDKGIAAQILMHAGLKLHVVRQEVLSLLGEGSAGILVKLLDLWRAGKITPQTREVIENAVEEARSLNHDYVGPEHLLLGLSLIRDDEVIIAQAFQNLGFTFDDVRREVLKLLREEKER
jgi:ATP-dependent Clp protease ATP-binding subunit ClpA